jgi:hypothetical protein
MTELQTLEIVQGEGKWIRFTFTRNGTALSMTNCTKKFGIKKSAKDTSYIYVVENTAETKWDTTNAATGVIRVNVPATVTKAMAPGKYECQGRFILTSDTDVDKTQRFVLKVVPGVIPD